MRSQTGDKNRFQQQKQTIPDPGRGGRCWRPAAYGIVAWGAHGVICRAGHMCPRACDSAARAAAFLRCQGDVDHPGAALPRRCCGSFPAVLALGSPCIGRV